MKKNNPARRAGDKNNLAPIFSEKSILARTKKPNPPPPPEYRMDRALHQTELFMKIFGDFAHIE